MNSDWPIEFHTLPDIARAAPVSPSSPRMCFQWWAVKQAQGIVLSVGSETDPLGLEQWAVHFDRQDLHELFAKRNLPFVQGDAHQLDQYFPLASFDTVILGDILEHAEDPLKMLVAACNVAKRIVAATVWVETRLPPGFTDNGEVGLTHRWNFTDDILEGVLEELLPRFPGLKVSWWKVPEVVHEGTQFYEYLIRLEKCQVNR